MVEKSERKWKEKKKANVRQDLNPWPHYREARAPPLRHNFGPIICWRLWLAIRVAWLKIFKVKVGFIIAAQNVHQSSDPASGKPRGTIFPPIFFRRKKWRQGFEFRESESLLRSQSAPTNLIVLNQMNVIWKCPINSSTDPRCIRLSGVRHQTHCEPGPWSWVRISSWIMFLLMDQIRSIKY